MKFAIFGNNYQTEKSVYARQLFSLIRKRGDEFITEEGYYRFLEQSRYLDIIPDGFIDTPSFDADMIISLGGDGTFLKAAAHVGASNIPILGINSGRLGFLANIAPTDMEQMLDLIHTGEYEIEERGLIEAKSERGDIAGYPFALNEVALLKHATSSMIALHVSVDGEPLITYQADGLIAATPTGSTGYSLSVGGPIVSPLADVFLLSPVAPHSLTARPLILRDDSALTITVESRSHNFLIAIDGRSESLSDNVRINLRKAPYRLHLVKRVGQTLFQILGQKMMWGVDTRN